MSLLSYIASVVIRMVCWFAQHYLLMKEGTSQIRLRMPFFDVMKGQENHPVSTQGLMVS